MAYDIGSIVLDNWKIVRLIGEGSFGKVYEIQKEMPGINPLHSALKVIQIPRNESELRSARSEGMDERSATTFFQDLVDEIIREINVMSQLKSYPGIVRVEDFEVNKDPKSVRWDILIRMELLTPLVDYTLDHTLTLAETLRLGIEISEALSHCHAQKLIHRDIKPENMFVDVLGHFKLGDFGIARTMEKSTNGMSSKGTEGYMAPEVYLGKEHYDQTVDIYSLGLVLYRFLNNNRLPFVPREITHYNDRHDALMRRIKGEAIPYIEGVDAQLNAIIQRACAYDPRLRYQKAEELGEALQTYADVNGIQWRVNKRTPEPAPKPKPEPKPAPKPEGDSKRRPADERGGSKEAEGTILRERASEQEDGPQEGRRSGGSGSGSDDDNKRPSRKIEPEPQPQPSPETPKKKGPKVALIIGAIVVVIGVALLIWFNVKPDDAALPVLINVGIDSEFEDALEDGPAFNGSYMRKEIASITFRDTLAGAPADAWDASQAGDGSVLAWVTPYTGSMDYLDAHADDYHTGLPDKLYDLVIAGDGGVRGPEYSSYLFCEFFSLRSIDFNGCYDTSGVLDMEGMFQDCEALESLDLSDFDTSNVTNMSSMFWTCRKLVSLDLFGVDTSNVTDMSYMFGICEALESLDLSGFNTSNVTNMSCMFVFTDQLSSVDVSSFDTSNVTNMTGMFNFACSLSFLDLSSFNTSNVTRMSEMLSDTQKLRSIKTGSGFVISSGTDTADMLLGSGLAELGISELGPDMDISNASVSVEPAEKPTPVLINVGFDSADENGSAFNGPYMRKEIASITFQDTLAGAPADAWDASQAGDGSVMAWATRYAGSTDYLGEYESKYKISLPSLLYDLVIAGDGGVTAPEDSSYLFGDFPSVQRIEFNNCFDTSGVTNMLDMFSGCYSLKTLDLSGCDTSNVTDMSMLFAACHSLQTLDVSGFDTSNVMHMDMMFAYCESLQALNLSGFDTSSVTEMNGMFRSCESLQTLDLSGFDTSSVTNMNSMFSFCESLQALNLSGFDTSNVTDMSFMFNETRQLTSIKTGNGFVIASDTSTTDILYRSGLWSLKISELGPDMDTSKASVSVEPAEKLIPVLINVGINSEPKDSLDEPAFNGPYMRKEIASITFRDTLAGAPADAWDASQAGDGSVLAWTTPYTGSTDYLSEYEYLYNSGLPTSLYDLVIAGDGGVIAPEDSNRLFSYFLSVQRIEFDSCLDTSGVTDMSLMFFACCYLQTLDVSNFDTVNVMCMDSMFDNCYSLQKLDVSGFDTSGVTDMNGMFSLCESLRELDVSGFDTSGVTDMSGMFSHCESLQELDVSGFDTSGVTDMGSMFAFCESLQELDVSGFDTSGVTDMGWMFASCNSLQSLDVSGFDTSNVTDMSNMFWNTEQLTSIKTGNGFVIASGTDTTNMLYDSGLAELGISKIEPGMDITPLDSASALSDITFDSTLYDYDMLHPKKDCDENEVTLLQQKLLGLGYLNDEVDGVYGRNTQNAVKAFQANNGFSSPSGVGTSITQYLLISGQCRASGDTPLAFDASRGNPLQIEDLSYTISNDRYCLVLDVTNTSPDVSIVAFSATYSIMSSPDSDAHTVYTINQYCYLSPGAEGEYKFYLPDEFSASDSGVSIYVSEAACSDGQVWHEFDDFLKWVAPSVDNNFTDHMVYYPLKSD